MFKINQKNEISLTRGDNAEFTVVLTDETNSDYTLNGADIITLSVKENINDSFTVLQKAYYGTSKIEIEPEDTRGLSFKKYVYDIQLNTHDGKVYTVVPPSAFYVLEEVTV